MPTAVKLFILYSSTILFSTNVSRSRHVLQMKGAKQERGINQAWQFPFLMTSTTSSTTVELRYSHVERYASGGGCVAVSDPHDLRSGVPVYDIKL